MFILNTLLYMESRHEKCYFVKRNDQYYIAGHFDSVYTNPCQKTGSNFHAGAVKDQNVKKLLLISKWLVSDLDLNIVL